MVSMATLRHPPTLKTLLADEEYSDYYDTLPVLPDSPSVAPPWQVCVEHLKKGWLVGFLEDYEEAADLADEQIEKKKVMDVVIISRRVTFPAPSFHKRLLAPGEEWCGRCRRPTIYRYYPHGHHALKHGPIVVAGQWRCYYCGVRSTDR